MSTTPDRPPNLLFLFTDEQRPDTMRAYGNDRIHTPNLDRLADTACVFDQPHCTTPLCTPSRGALMTGRYAHAHGAWHNNVPLDADARCLPELLPPEARRGYACEYHGKWHLGDEVFAQHGFERFASIEDGYAEHYSDGRPADTKSDYHHHLLSLGYTLGSGDYFGRGFACQVPEGHGKPAFLAGRASRFIDANRDSPWMLMVNFLEPHMPFHGPRDGQYDPTETPLPSNFDHDPRGDDTLPGKVREQAQRWMDHGFEGFPLDSADDWRAMTARYWGLCSLVDTHVGRVLDTLAATGQDRDTLIVYTSDHGEMMGSHKLLAKNVNYKESLRVPLIVRLPGQDRGCRLTGPVSQIDLVPTLLDLMGHDPADTGEDLQGRSLAGLLREAAGTGGDHDAARDASPCVCTTHLDAADDERSHETRTLVTPDGWRYTWSAAGEHELYDLNNDADERHNVVSDPAHTDRVAGYVAELRAWQRRTGDDRVAVGLTPGV